MVFEFPSRPMVFVAHPDDETIACASLLQKAPTSLVVFATDGAAPGFGCERKFGSLKAYSEMRFQEASRALGHIPTTSFQRLTKPDGSYFVEVHLFEELREAATALSAIARQFSPDAIVSHAYEGAHIDHDACSFVAVNVGIALGLKVYEFPLYWLDERGKPVLQRFRDGGVDVVERQLSEAEIQVKKRMMAEYHTQRGTISTFDPSCERMRLAVSNGSAFSVVQCRDYMYQDRRPRFYHTRRHRISAKVLLRKFAEFEASKSLPKDNHV